MTYLSPDPAEVAELLIGMMELPWPTTEVERRRYFEVLGLEDLDVVPPREDEPDNLSRWFTTSLAGDVHGICTMFRDEFLGLDLFCYNEPGDKGPRARAGFAGIQDGLKSVFGDPDEVWGPTNEPACLWQLDPLQLDMHCFQRGSSGVMVGPDHAARSAANDAAHQE